MNSNTEKKTETNTKTNKQTNKSIKIKIVGEMKETIINFVPVIEFSSIF